MATMACFICGTEYENGDILLDKKMRKILKTRTLVGNAPCPECGPKMEDYAALVVIDPERSSIAATGIINPAEAHRTGEIMWMKKGIASEVLGQDMTNLPMAFIDKDTYDHLASLAHPNDRP